jgi:hypothetical protein
MSLLQSPTGICRTNSGIAGVIKTTYGIMIMIKTGDTQTITEWEGSSCGSVLLDNFATKYQIPVESGKTDIDLQSECSLTCNTLSTSLCPCSPAVTGIYYVDPADQITLNTMVTSGGQCVDATKFTFSPPMNTDNGLVSKLTTIPGYTFWDFQQTPCGVAVKQIQTSVQLDKAVIDPLIEECWYTNHWECNTTATNSLCKCSNGVKLVYLVPTAQVSALEASRSTGSCATTPRASIFDIMSIEGGALVYVVTAAGRSKYDFESIGCGAQVISLQEKTYTSTETEAIATACWSHGDHGHCGPTECPCPIPTSLIVTPIVFTLNQTHTSKEGIIYFNNYFIEQFRNSNDCSFSRYLSTYADDQGLSLRLYIDAFKSTQCTQSVMDSITLSSFRSYWLNVVERFEAAEAAAGGEEEEHDHEHFAILADDHDHDAELMALKVAGIVSIKIEDNIPLEVEHCWNSTTDGIKCIGEDENCPILCPLGGHCHEGSDCGTGICGEMTSTDGETDGDHDHEHDHAHFSILADDLVCLLKTNGSIGFNFNNIFAAVVVIAIALF